MRTLDEVIKAMEMCTTSPEDDEMCPGCPYADADGNPECVGRDKDDALHYLKAFRDAKDTLVREKDRYAEAVKNCERAEGIYKQKQKAAEDALWICKEDKDDLTALRAYWAERQENRPLTWDELKGMEGKPVWVEYNLHLSDKDARSRMWIIVQKIMPWRYNNELIYYSGFVFGKKEIGKTWQAYRKERE